MTRLTKIAVASMVMLLGTTIKAQHKADSMVILSILQEEVTLQMALDV